MKKIVFAILMSLMISVSYSQTRRINETLQLNSVATVTTNIDSLLLQDSNNVIVKTPYTSLLNKISTGIPAPTLQAVHDAGNIISDGTFKTSVYIGELQVENISSLTKVAISPAYQGLIAITQNNTGLKTLNLRPVVLTSNRTIYFPDGDGTIALSEDLVSQYVGTSGDQEISGTKAFGNVTQFGFNSSNYRTYIQNDKLTFSSPSGNTSLKARYNTIVDTFLPELGGTLISRINMIPAGNNGNVTLVGTTAPTSATDTGIQGEIRITATYVYICLATNTWVRAAVATW